MRTKQKTIQNCITNKLSDFHADFDVVFYDFMDSPLTFFLNYLFLNEGFSELEKASSVFF